MRIQSADLDLPAASANSDWPRGGADASARTVHVIDDDDSFRRSMLRILRASGYAAAGYGCAGEFLLALSGEATGCILLDISMPGPSGIELLRALTQRGSRSPIIFLTARDDIMTSVDAMKDGAFDYIVKPVAADRVLAVVERALQLYAQRLAARNELQILRARFALLTDAERAIFVGVVAHRLNKQMAGDLGACERTVKALRARMLAKLHVETVPDLVRAAALLESMGVSIERAEAPRRSTAAPPCDTRRLTMPPVAALPSSGT